MHLLFDLSKRLKAQRISAGALTLASPEVRFEMDSETNDPLSMDSYKLKDTNSLVEEFMLLANTLVAKRITEAFPKTAVLRRHPIPDMFPRFSLLIVESASTISSASRSAPAYFLVSPFPRLVHAALREQQAARGFAGQGGAPRGTALQQAAAHPDDAVHDAGGVLPRGGGSSRAVLPLRPGGVDLHALHVADPAVRGRRGAPTAGGGGGNHAAAGGVPREGVHGRNDGGRSEEGVGGRR